MIVAILVMLLISGCARFQPKAISPVTTAADSDTRTLGDEGLRAFVETNLSIKLPSWPKAEWDFEKLTLAAFYFHPDLDAARARWATTQAGETTAGQRPNPTVTATPGYNPTTTIPSPWFTSFSVDVPIETAGKRGHRIARAQHLSESARLNIASVAWW